MLAAAVASQRASAGSAGDEADRLAALPPRPSGAATRCLRTACPSSNEDAVHVIDPVAFTVLGTCVEWCGLLYSPGLSREHHTWPAMAMKAIAAPRSASHRIVIAAVFALGRGCLTFSPFMLETPPLAAVFGATN